MARFGDKGRPEFVRLYAGYGILETTAKAQQAVRYTSLEDADKVARALGDGWFPVAWKV